MGIDVKFSGLLVKGEREILNKVISNPGNPDALDQYADWLASYDDARSKFLRSLSQTVQTWDAAGIVKPAGVSKPWLEMVGYRIVNRIANRGLSAHADLIFSLARPALKWTPRPADDEQLKVGSSKFGGQPDVPPDFTWPIGDDCKATYNDDTAGEKRLSGFIGQINLEELNPVAAADALPDTGLLSIFGFQDLENDNPDKIGVMVRWFPDLKPLSRLSPPGKLTEGNECFSPWQIDFKEIFDQPSDSGPWEKDLAPIISADEGAFNFGNWDNIRNMMGYAVGTTSSDPTDSKESRHLIFFDGAITEYQWPGLHLQINKHDLANRDFDKIMLEWVDWD